MTFCRSRLRSVLAIFLALAALQFLWADSRGCFAAALRTRHSALSMRSMAAKHSSTWPVARDGSVRMNAAAAARKTGARVQLAERVSRFATVAGFLCILDCTALPIVVIAMQLSGLASPSISARLHEIGHMLAIYFVLPIGGTATLSNYLVHRRLPVTLGALLGLAAIFATNGHGGPLKMLPGSWRHQLHCCHGVTHKAVNLLGCALLIGSNYVSQRMARSIGGGACCSQGCHSHGGQSQTHIQGEAEHGDEHGHGHAA